MTNKDTLGGSIMSHLREEKKMKYKFIFNQDTWWREFEENIVSTWFNQLKTNGKMLVDNIFYDKNKNYHLILKNFKKQINVVAQ